MKYESTSLTQKIHINCYTNGFLSKYWECKLYGGYLVAALVEISSFKSSEIALLWILSYLEFWDGNSSVLDSVYL